MSRDGRSEADKTLQVLIQGRVVEREAAQNRLLTQDTTVDRDHLRKLILEALEGPFDVSKATQDPSYGKARARCWLLSTLGRIAGDDQRALDYVRRHTAGANEPNMWAGYWALESLVVAQAPDLVALARDLWSHEQNPLVRQLAAAILAREGDAAALKEITDGIAAGSLETLRALRVIPLEETVHPICNIIASPACSDTTYDAVVALGMISPDWASAEKAITTLIACIKVCREHPWWDGMRVKALQALHRLNAGEAEPLLIRELSDSNLSVVYEAARALEGIAGVDKATAHIVEAANQTGPEALCQYGNALRWMNRDKVAEKLASLMLSGPPEQQNTARGLLSEIGGQAAFQKLRARTDTMKQHMDTLEKTEEGIRELFDSSLREARYGYVISTVMETVVFALGIGLIIASAVLALQKQGTLAGLTGAGGALTVLYNLFLANPRRRVQQAAEYLMTLKVIFLGYLRQLHQSDKAYVRRFLEESPLEPEDVKRYSAIVAETMRDAVAQIRSSSARTRSASTDQRGMKETVPARGAAPTLSGSPG